MKSIFENAKIRTRILLALLLLTLMSLISFALISFMGMKNLGSYATELNESLGQETLRVSMNAMQNLARSGILRITTDQANLFDAEFKNIETQVSLMAAFAEIGSSKGGNDGVLTSPSMESVYRSIISSNSFLSHITVSFANGTFRIYPLQGKAPAGFDPRKLEWYVRALSSGKTGWSNPYLNPVTNKVYICCSKPVFDQKRRLVGVIGIDVALATINDRVLRAQLNNQGIALLLDQNRKVITKQGVALGDSVGKSEYFHMENEGEERRRLDEALLAGKSGVAQGNYLQRDCYIAYAPVATTKWSVLLVLPVEEVNAPIRPTERSISSQLKMVQTQVYTKITLSLVILTFFFAVMIGVVVFVARKVAGIITAPIVTLEDGVRIIGEGNLDHRLEISSGDEIQALADSFNKMTADLQTYIRNLTETTAAKERIQGELKVATDIQASLLPRIFPPFPDRPEIDIYAMMDPAKEVGGDFYDFFFIDDRHLFFVIGDVSDKGVPAALFMMVSKTLLKTEALRNSKPDEILASVNRQLYPDNQSMMFVTVFCAVLDVESGELSYSNAGHNPPLHWPVDASPYHLAVPPGLVAGAMPDACYQTRTLTLQEDDVIFLYTDGVTEAMDTSAKLYGDSRLIATLSRQGSRDVDGVVQEILKDIREFTKGATQSDDVTMLALRFAGKNSRPRTSGDTALG